MQRLAREQMDLRAPIITLVWAVGVPNLDYRYIIPVQV